MKVSNEVWDTLVVLQDVLRKVKCDGVTISLNSRSILLPSLEGLVKCLEEWSNCGWRSHYDVGLGYIVGVWVIVDKEKEIIKHYIGEGETLWEAIIKVLCRMVERGG